LLKWAVAAKTNIYDQGITRRNLPGSHVVEARGTNTSKRQPRYN
jgi:hypothetical protein